MIPRALTIAGSDPSGGAGIQADLKTFTVLGVYGMSAITALTAQNTMGVTGIHAVPPEFVRAQVDAVLTDIGADAVKTGMLANHSIIAAVAAAVRDLGVEKLVVDPVLIAQSGAALLEDDARDQLRDALIPRALLVTPNAPEAEALLGIEVRDLPGLREAARRFVAAGARAALVKGGHLTGDESIDVFHDGRQFEELRAARVATPHTHGTGCTLSAAITAELAKGVGLLDAVHSGKAFVTAAIRSGLAIGHGHGPANVLAHLSSSSKR